MPGFCEVGKLAPTARLVASSLGLELHDALVQSGRRLVEFAQANYPQAGYASADELEAELRAGLAEGAAVVETAYANAAGALAALSAVQEAIDNEEFPLAAERFDAFLQSWNGEPAELQAEVDRIKLLLPEGCSRLVST